MPMILNHGFNWRKVLYFRIGLVRAWVGTWSIVAIDFRLPEGNYVKHVYLVSRYDVSVSRYNIGDNVINL